MISHQYNQFSAYSVQVAPSTGNQNGQEDSPSRADAMDTDAPASATLPPEGTPNETTNRNADSIGKQDADAPPESGSNGTIKMEVIEDDDKNSNEEKKKMEE